MIGTLLAKRYEIVERIGGGGWALVYRAKDTFLDRTVAVKVLRSQFTADEEFVRRFRREAQAAAALSHPNVVSVYDVGHDGDTHYIVMECIEGSTLKEKIDASGALPVGEAARIVAQILDALDHAHQNRIIHRDIKPHNILVTKSGRIKVTDFGIARAASAATLAHTGSIVGSAHYFSPEQARGGFTGEKSDIYSTGVVLYEMITGQVPFTGEDPIAVALKHVQEKPEPPSQRNPKVPPQIDHIVLKALEKDPSRRYSSARAMLDDLQLIMRDQENGRFADQAAREELLNALAAPAAADARAAAVRTTAASSEAALAPNEITQTLPPRRTGNAKLRYTRVALWLAFFAALAGAITWGVVRLNQWLNVPDVQVPAVEGMTLTQAADLLRSKELEFRPEQVPDEKPAGTVIRQDPKANSVVRKNRLITLTVSTGPETSEVPPLVGKSVAEAEAALAAANLKLGQLFPQHDSGKPPDTVVGQRMPAGMKVAKNAVIDLDISSGKSSVTVPPLSGLTQADAERRLADLKLEVAVTEVNDTRFSPGVVVDQNPRAGEKRLEGDTVTLAVNRGPAAKTRSVRINAPLYPGAVDLRVELNDQRGTSTIYRQTVAPGQPIDLTITWVGDVASYQVYANGNLIQQEQLR